MLTTNLDRGAFITTPKDTTKIWAYFFVNNKSGQKKEWTWPQLDSINLFAEIVQNELAVSISNPDGGQVPYPLTYFYPSAKESIMLALGEEGKQSSLIAAAYDTNSGLWMFHSLVPGKVSSTFEAMAYLQRCADNITREHLEGLATLTVSPPNNHPNTHPNTHHPFATHSPLVSNSNSTPSPVTPSSSSPHGHSPALNISKRSPGIPEGSVHTPAENQNKLRQVLRRDQSTEQPDLKKRRLHKEDK